MRIPRDETPATRRPLTQSEVAHLRAASLCSENTIKHWWNGTRPVQPSTIERLAKASAEIGLLDPPACRQAKRAG
jgi:hypothetical protein